ncbi:type II toxin-antitoxin system ParD family antitoxin [Caulobacter hibisci]|uniref:Type II toxin-antitoxin system ParD family antitoxin n=1 Tax=Caulobacter hibisci TaxID=2035993 RepID=A0ABS0T0Q7_9CAUL|nr:type II toxin-antitoxin system ParD family antitoxin [Caulobacter hibisci]MBI1685450.1 type II toxin-antitoxin system ParD family antitoxin [Caulobacter hibisci]
MATSVQLTDDLERFARDCVEDGRYDTVDEVVRSALRLMRDAERQRTEFNAMLVEATAQADREGTFTAEEIFADIDARSARA